jgi:hypothetical protein
MQQNQQKFQKMKLTLLNLSFLAALNFAATNSIAQPLTNQTAPLFENRWNLSSDAQQFTAKCSPSLTETEYQRLLTTARKGNIQSTRFHVDRNYVLFSQTAVFCIPQSRTGFPLLSARHLSAAFSIETVQAQTMEPLYEGIATDLAETGTSDAIVISDSGTAIKVSFRMKEKQPVEYFVTSEFLKPGSFNASEFKNTLTVNFKSLITNVEGPGGRRSLVSGVFVDQPLMHGNYLANKANGETKGFSFENTTWKFGDTSSTIELQAGGKLTMRPQYGIQSDGTWMVQDGMFMMNYGQTFMAGNIEAGKTLVLNARVLGTSGTDMTSNGRMERRWNLKLSLK